ncbi:kinase-like domain-containing protein [Lentinula lateritia]|uniref:Kinase-like domain-containing protein n=1 Tax=Lentinula lateritia TaxID=40482 RepID=A0ABQ8VQZ0_9AGAR|nr:kinase-like domain-containing protein [Lentinula lateritia]
MRIEYAHIETWQKNGTYVFIHDSAPGTLSSRILSLYADIPPLDTHSQIFGDSISPIAYKDCPLEHEELQRIQKTLSVLPVISIDEERYFVKETRSSGEVINLLKTKGGPQLVELLGRTEDGKLVFPRHLDFAAGVFMEASISVYKQILLQLADAIIFLHSRGIIHRDIALRNILASKDRQNIVLCDLESQYGSHMCPEISFARFQQGIPDSELPYSEKSDVFCFGTTMADFILVNHIQTPWQYFSGSFIPPPPFDEIVRACIKRDPVDRPSMSEVKAMLESIAVPGTLLNLLVVYTQLILLLHSDLAIEISDELVLLNTHSKFKTRVFNIFRNPFPRIPVPTKVSF